MYDTDSCHVSLSVGRVKGRDVEGRNERRADNWRNCGTESSLACDPLPGQFHNYDVIKRSGNIADQASVRSSRTGKRKGKIEKKEEDAQTVWYTMSDKARPSNRRTRHERTVSLTSDL